MPHSAGFLSSRTAEPAKNWGLPTLSQGGVGSRRKPLFRRRVDRAGCPQFFAPSTQARGVFIAIVIKSPPKEKPQSLDWGSLQFNWATSYSPTHLRVQYHRG